MALILKTGRKPQWIEVLEDRSKKKSKKNPVLGMFEVLPLTPSETQDIYNQCLKQVWYTPPGKRSKPERDQEANPIEFVINKAKKVILNWKDIFTIDDNGNMVEVKYSEDMIEVLYENNPDIIGYVLEEADKISSLNNELEEDEIKN
jgi:hypothetical protein